CASLSLPEGIGRSGIRGQWISLLALSCFLDSTVNVPLHSRCRIHRGGAVESRNPFGCFDRRYLAEALAAAAVLIGLALVGKRFPVGSAARIGFGAAETIVFGLTLAVTLLRIG